MRGWCRSLTGHRSRGPVLVGRIPNLPHAVAERALCRELVPLSVQKLVYVVLNAPGSSRILNVLIQTQYEMGNRRVIAEALPP